jgi:hypothetical protein
MWRTRVTVAFDATCVCAVRAVRGWRDWKMQVFAREALSAGALVPSTVEANIVRPVEVLAALDRLKRRVGGPNVRALAMLPSGVALLIRVDAPREATTDFHRFRIASDLPYPAAEAVIDLLRLGGGAAILGAVRRGVIQDYEKALAQTGWLPKRVDLAPLAALDRLRRRPPSSGVGVDLILGDAAFLIAAWTGGVLKTIRHRRRDGRQDEMERLWDEVNRTVAQVAEGAAPVVRVVGSGARVFLMHMHALGRSATLAWELHHDTLDVEGAELAWIGAALR